MAFMVFKSSQYGHFSGRITRACSLILGCKINFPTMVRGSREDIEGIDRLFREITESISVPQLLSIAPCLIIIH